MPYYGFSIPREKLIELTTQMYPRVYIHDMYIKNFEIRYGIQYAIINYTERISSLRQIMSSRSIDGIENMDMDFIIVNMITSSQQNKRPRKNTPINNLTYLSIEFGRYIVKGEYEKAEKTLAIIEKDLQQLRFELQQINSSVESYLNSIKTGHPVPASMVMFKKVTIDSFVCCDVMTSGFLAKTQSGEFCFVISTDDKYFEDKKADIDYHKHTEQIHNKEYSSTLGYF